MIYNIALNEYDRLKSLIQDIELRLDGLPKGTVYCTKDGKYDKWYHNLDHTINYLNRKQHTLKVALIFKKYLILLYKEAVQEMTAISIYLKQYDTISHKSQLMFKEDSPYRQFLMPHFQSDRMELHEHINSSYTIQEYNPKTHTHQSISGNTLRTHADALIDHALFLHKIPYLYGTWRAPGRLPPSPARSILASCVRRWPNRVMAVSLPTTPISVCG